MTSASQWQDPPLSVFGESRIQEGKHVESFDEVASNAYDPVHNPNGIINLGVAENTLLYKELADYFDRNLRLSFNDFTYGSCKGDARLRGAIADLMNMRFEPHQLVTPDHLVLGAGLVPVLANLAGTIANSGDGLLIASPYYYGFDYELPLLTGVVPVGVQVPLKNMFTVSELSYFEKAIQENKEKGTIIKGVILCNPHNPYGRAYPREVVIEYCKFCEKHNLHLISDEIYALSIFPSRDIPNPPPFVSVLSLDLEAIGVRPSRVHVLYGMSKDFNCNGFRVGVLVTQHNQAVLRSMTVAALFMLVSSPASTLWATLLTDEEFLPHFLDMNRLSLQEAYEYATAWLNFHKIPYISASAGHFLVADMRSVLSDVDKYSPVFSITAEQGIHEREATLFKFLIERGVVLNQGSMCHLEAGWFRITFSVRRDFMDHALARIEDALGWEKSPDLLRED